MMKTSILPAAGLSILFAVAAASVAAQDGDAWCEEELRRFPATEANQGVAVDAEFFYAIDNRTIGKYDKTTGERIGGWEGEQGGPIKHLNGGVVIAGKLYCAHSNFPTVPEHSSLEIWDTATMRHVGRHVFKLAPGSLTWAVRYKGGWAACFAHYQRTSNPAKSRVVWFDAEGETMARWRFPASLIERFAGHSASGGAFGPGGHLYVTGHDADELYVLDVPATGAELVWRTTIPVSAHGQAFAWDSTAADTLYSIDRPARQVIVSRIHRCGDARPSTTTADAAR